MLTENFVIQEFVPPEVYKIFGVNSIWFIDFKVVSIAQWLRDYHNSPVTINNWHVGGKYTESGFRYNTSLGASFSQHKYGRAIDVKIKDVEPNQIRDSIVDNFEELRDLGLTTIEAGTKTWVHLDVRFTDKKELFVVWP